MPRDMHIHPNLTTTLSLPNTYLISPSKECWFTGEESRFFTITRRHASNCNSRIPHSSSTILLLVAAQSCPTLCDPVDCSPPGSSVHGILQARILGWVALPSPGHLPDPGIKLESPALQVDSSPLHRLGSPLKGCRCAYFSDLVIDGNRKQLNRRTMGTAEGRWSTCDQRYTK